MNANIILRTENLVKYYGSGENLVRAVDHTSFEVERGKFTAIVGRSGSGKSTLLHLIGGLDRPDEGKVWIEEKNIFSMKNDRLAEFRRKKIGFIFQDYNLINELTVYENIILPFQLKKKECKEELIDKFLAKLKLEEKKNAFPMQLSGGEQQRAAILRALLSEPDIILADEPTGNLDSKNTQMVVGLLRYFSEHMGKTILFITHNMELTKYCSRVIAVKDGKIIT